MVMVKETKIFFAHLLVSTAERERGGLLGGPDVFRRLPRGSPLKMPSSSLTSLKIKEKAFTVIFPVTMSCDFQSRPDGFHQTFHWRRRHPKCPKFSLASLNSKHIKVPTDHSITDQEHFCKNTTNIFAIKIILIPTLQLGWIRV